MPRIVTSHDVLEPLKQVRSASRDVIISGQICGLKFQEVFTLGDGCWLQSTEHQKSLKLGKSSPPKVGPRPPSFQTPKFRGFEKGLAGGGWRLAGTKIQQKIVLQKCVPLLIGGDRKKGAEKRPESVAWEGFPRAHPLSPPTPFRNF